MPRGRSPATGRLPSRRRQGEADANTGGAAKRGAQAPLLDSRPREPNEPGGAKAEERRAVGRRRSRPGAHVPRSRRLWGAKPPIPAPSGGQGPFGRSPSNASAGPPKRGRQAKGPCPPEGRGSPQPDRREGWSRRREGNAEREGVRQHAAGKCTSTASAQSRQGEHEASGGTPSPQRRAQPEV